MSEGSVELSSFRLNLSCLETRCPENFSCNTAELVLTRLPVYVMASKGAKAATEKVILANVALLVRFY